MLTQAQQTSTRSRSSPPQVWDFEVWPTGGPTEGRFADASQSSLFELPNLTSTLQDCYLVYILTEMSGCTSMVFTRTCDATSFGFGSSESWLLSHSDQWSNESDVASRGLDIYPLIWLSTMIYRQTPRVGRTARAGRSGVAISLVNQYEVEWYKQIEKLIGKELPQFQAEEEEVMLLSERVTEAKRISHMKMKESGGRKKRKGGGDDGEEDVDKCLGLNNGKSSKKFKKK